MLEKAKKAGVGVLSVTDHNILDGTEEIIRINRDEEVKCIPGVEIDAIDFGMNFHILAYGIDLNNIEFRKFLEENLERLKDVNIKLLEKMKKDYPEISIEEYNDFEHDRRKGGWPTLQYFVAKGLSKGLKEGIKHYIDYEHSYTCVDFPSIKEVCDKIHVAGGKAVLAHPEEIIKTDSLDEFRKILLEIAEFGIDGIEAYYFYQSKEVTELCLAICKERNLMITSGCDCHGDFDDSDIGEMKLEFDKVRLGDLLVE